MKSLPLLLIGLLLLGSARAQETKKELTKFQGTWSPVKLVYDGKDLTDDTKVKFKLVFKGDQATVTGSEEVEKEYAKLTFKLEPSTTPKIMDVTVAGGVQKGTVIEGIYEIKKDELKICAKIIGKERPAEFASPAGSSVVLVILKREKD